MYRIIFILLLSSHVFSQSFIVNVPNNGSQFLTNYYEVNISGCSTTQQNICTSQTGICGDIAMDSSGNLYSAFGPDLYKYNSTSENCVLIAAFPMTINSMIADSQGNIYVSGSPYKIYKYSPVTNNVTLVGDLPPQTMPVGDFFFFENRLFLTCQTTNYDNPFLLEVNLTNPTQSINYMSLQNLYPLAATSINIGVNSKSYIISGTPQQSFIREIDIISRTISPIICTINYEVFGAASYYNQSNVLVNNEFNLDRPFIKIKNPAVNFINIETNINKSDFKSIKLYDITGRIAKEYNAYNQDLDISGIQSGYYIVSFEVNSQQFNLKVLIKN